jgi:excisionase family DNA binding protein
MKTIMKADPPRTPGGGDLLSRKELAALLKVDVKTIDNWRKKQGLPSTKIGGRVFISGAAFQEFFESRSNGRVKSENRGQRSEGRGRKSRKLKSEMVG